MPTTPSEFADRCILRGLDDNSLYRWYDQAKAAQVAATGLIDKRVTGSQARRIAAELRRRGLRY